MANAPGIPGYGTPNLELLGRWLQLAPDEDGPFWAVNLMRYRSRADYGGGDDRGLSGREADDAYTPTGPLEAVGAVIAFAADVVDQRGAEPSWHRVGIVRYPSRKAFFAMQQRDDFQALHEHKEAGMERTVVLACQPSSGTPVAHVPDDGALLRVVRHDDGDAGGASVRHPGRVPTGAADAVLLRFDVEGVIIGDGRSWDEVRVERPAVAGPAAPVEPDDAAEACTLVLRPNREHNRLAASVLDVLGR